MTYYQIPDLETLHSTSTSDLSFLVGKTDNSYLVGIYIDFPCYKCVKSRFRSSSWFESSKYRALADEELLKISEHIKDEIASFHPGVIWELDSDQLFLIKQHKLLPNPKCSTCCHEF
ncbi:hypothetical protein [Microcoleus sp. D3_18a_C4]|uniref:hypothetical protein n=1 Tax=unclassified Microcoleus TaxID=2642155 RepID=UPI002FD2D28B